MKQKVKSRRIEADLYVEIPVEKVMNTNTENKIEETFEAARDRLNDYRHDDKYSNRDVFNHGFTSGINWQKEKDKAINYRLLNALKDFCDPKTAQSDPALLNAYNNAIEAIKKAEA